MRWAIRPPARGTACCTRVCRGCSMISLSPGLAMAWAADAPGDRAAADWTMGDDRPDRGPAPRPHGDRHDRHDRGPSSGQPTPVDRWHAPWRPTYADAILDRLVHNAIRLPLKGNRCASRRPAGVNVSADAERRQELTTGFNTGDNSKMQQGDAARTRRGEWRGNQARAARQPRE